MVSSAISNATRTHAGPPINSLSRARNSTRTSNQDQTETLHKSSSPRNVIDFAHLKSYFKLEGDLVGQTQIFDKQLGKKLDLEVRRVIDGDDETYKLVVNNEVIAFRTLNVVTDDKDTKQRSSLAAKLWKYSPLNGFGADKKRQAKIVGEFTANRYPDRYSGVFEIFMQVISDRMQELEKTHKLKFQGLQIVTSYNSGSFFYNKGFKLEEHKTADAWSAKKCDKFIAGEIKRAGSVEKADTEELGCTTMFLPKSAKKQWATRIKKAPLLNKDGTDLEDGGKVTLTKKDGTQVEARIHKERNQKTGIDLFKIEANGEELASIQVNYMRMKDGKVHDYCGDYDKTSPFSQYGNGKCFGLFGRKTPQSKVFIEIEEVLSDEYKDLREKLYQIPIEIAQKDKEFQGRVQAEADWNEHAIDYELGFRTQQYRGLKDAKALKSAYEKEIALAKKENRSPNVKNFGSQIMTMTRDEILSQYSSTKILTN